MNYDSITIDPVYADWSWALPVLIVSGVVAIIGLVIAIHMRDDFGMKITPTIGVLAVICGFVGVMASGLTVYMNFDSTLRHHQEEALVSQLGFTSARIDEGFGSNSYSAQNADGSFVTGILEEYEENTYIVIPDTPER